MKKRTSLISSFLVAIFTVSSASAHVVVKPSEVETGSFESFSVGVPNEKEVPTTGLRLVMPKGLEYVSANLSPGWTIDIKKDGTGEDAAVTEIVWSGNEIPAGYREDFVFSAKVPDADTKLTWKAYQTYQGGEVVAWDMENVDENAEGTKPASTTEVVTALSGTHDEADDSKANTTGNIAGIALFASIAALAVGLYSLFRKK